MFMDALPPTASSRGDRAETAELCAAVEGFAEIREAMVVDAGQQGEDGVRLLFVVMGPGEALDDALRAAITARLRAGESSRRLPDAIYAAPELPRTADGEKHPAVVQSILTGERLDDATGSGAVANPEALSYFADLFNNL